ncbi:calcineurin-like phosphoesterase [Achlya hypogyna]|uniref:Purple acid phosphatase n=1 Tax=Achlya hypogyna TaxID=1202772 RepID=A0A1V9ZFN6_ACHHY|nr:calcineurin-like phosphoesterase [Achlya hypogyna]
MAFRQRIGLVAAATVLFCLMTLRDNFERRAMRYYFRANRAPTLDDDGDTDDLDETSFMPGWIENCVPYNISSTIDGAGVASVSWRTHRMYMSSNDDGWVECGVGAGHLQYRVMGGASVFATVNSISERDVAGNVTTHVASFAVPDSAMPYEFIVGSHHHGYSSLHRLGENIDYASTREFDCRPVRIHTAFGLTPDAYSIQWATDDSCTRGDHVLVLEEGDDARFDPSTAMVLPADSFTFGVRQEHVVLATSLKSNTRYSYYVGNSAYSRSIVHSFTTARGVDDASAPLRLLVTGDIGYQNAATLPMMQSEVARGLVDAVVSVGDYAYNLHSAKGVVGDIFMTEIEPIAAAVPFMVAMGNHEVKQHFSHYTHRFQLMPANARAVTIQGIPRRNNWFYSYNVGLVHFVVINTEVYFTKHTDEPAIAARQRAWLEADLLAANRNRTAAPWVIVVGHRPLYCTSDTECDMPASILRDAFEDLFYEHGVDLYLCGHQHNYERMYDVYRGTTERKERNMRATTHILTGAAGQSRVLPVRKPFLRPAEAWDAFRNNIFGYGRLVIQNATHLHWQQVECDPANPAASHLNGKAVDDVWLIQEHHGSFAH